MNLAKIFATNKTKESEGVWVDGPEGTRFKIARMGNPQYTAMLQRLLTPHRVALRQGRMDDTVLTKITHEVMAHTILLDWEHVDLDEQNKDVAYTPGIGKQCLADWPDFADFVSGQAQSFANYAQEEEKAIEKN